MCTFVGPIDCIDKLKLALRQSLELQKQLSTHTFSDTGSCVCNKERTRYMKHSYLITSYFGGG